MPVLVLLASTSIAPKSEAAALYNFTDLGNLSPQAINAQGMVAGSGEVYSGYGPNAGQVVTIPGAYDSRGINDLGQVIGSTTTGTSYLATPNPSNGGPLSYSTVDLGANYVSAINNLGQIVGQNADGRAFITSGGTTTDLGTLGGSYSFATAINAFGQVVGGTTVDSSNLTLNAFLATNGKMTDLGSLGGFYAFPSGINAAGQVSGVAIYLDGSAHAFLDSNGKMMDLGSLGGQLSVASGLNAAGQVIGYSALADGTLHPFLYSNGVLTDLNNLIPLPTGWSLTEAVGINDAGQIVGDATDSSGVNHGFLLTPAGMALPVAPSTVPEPGSLAIFGLAVGGFVAEKGLATTGGLNQPIEPSDGRAVAVVGLVPGRSSSDRRGFRLARNPRFPDDPAAEGMGCPRVSLSGMDPLMSLLRVRTCLPILALLSLIAPKSDAAALYTFTALGDFDPEAINANGVVAGHGNVVNQGGYGSVYHAYGPEAGRFTTLPGSYDIRGINSRGQVVGVGISGSSYLATPNPGGGTTYTAQDGPQRSSNAINDLGQIVGRTVGGHAFLQSNGKTTDLGTFGGTSSNATGINAFGQVVGSASLDPTNTIEHAFLYTGGKKTDLGTLGGQFSSASGINAAGQIVGYSTTAGGLYHPFLYSGGKMIDLGALGGNFSSATAINASGQVVGDTSINGQWHAFLYSHGVMRDLNSLVPLPTGWSFEFAWGINDSGQIIGEVRSPNGNGYGYLLTPAGMAAPVAPSTVPEPGSLAVFGLAVVGFVARRAWRRRAS